MASGPHYDPRRGSWSVRWFDGMAWKKVTVADRPMGWRPGDPRPSRPPAEALAGLLEYTRKEEEARAGRLSPSRSVDDFLRDYREGYVAARAASSLVELDRAIAGFLAWCEAGRIARVEDLTAEECRRWLRERAAGACPGRPRPASRATIAKERGLLAAAWTAADEEGTLGDNPWRRAKLKGGRERGDRGSWTPEQYRALIAASRPWLRDLLSLGCHTGLRIAALLALEWADIRWPLPGDDNLGFVVVRKENDKAARGYAVPIGRELHAMLTRRQRDRDPGVPTVIAGQAGKPLVDRSTTHVAIRRACRRAGLERPRSPNHHMRRTFGRWAVAGHLTGKPVPVYVVSKWLGHSTIAVTMTYLALDEQDSTRFMLGEN